MAAHLLLIALAAAQRLYYPTSADGTFSRITWIDTLLSPQIATASTVSASSPEPAGAESGTTSPTAAVSEEMQNQEPPEPAPTVEPEMTVPVKAIQATSETPGKHRGEPSHAPPTVEEQKQAGIAAVKARGEEKANALKLAEDQAARERVAAEAEKKRLAAMLAERVAAEERAAAEREAAEGRAAAQAAMERSAREEATRQRAEEERLRAEVAKLAAERAAMERAAVERAIADAERARLAALEAERAAAEERAVAERRKMERIAAEKAAARRVAIEKEAREKAEKEKARAERARAERVAAERAALEEERKRVAAALAERAAAERVAPEKRAVERVAAEKAAAERAAMEKRALEQKVAAQKAHEAAVAARSSATRPSSPAGMQHSARKTPLLPLPLSSNGKENSAGGGFQAPLKGDLLVELTGKGVVPQAQQFLVLFREYPESRHRRPMTPAESRRVMMMKPKVARIGENTVQLAIETAREGVYEFRGGQDGTIESACTVTLSDSSGKKVVKTLAARKIGAGQPLVKILMPEKILWEDESNFNGSMEDAGSITKYNSGTGLVWKEYKL